MTKEQFFGMYIGQIIQVGSANKNFLNIKVFEDYVSIGGYGFSHDINDCKLILRPFSSMTDEEIRILYSFPNSFAVNVDIAINHKTFNVKQYEYLISIGVDVFNLCERGWAVYESGVNNVD